MGLKCRKYAVVVLQLIYKVIVWVIIRNGTKAGIYSPVKRVESNFKQIGLNAGFNIDQLIVDILQGFV